VDGCVTHSGHRGANHPIMHLHERSLSVLACRYVDEVIIGAPWEVTKDMITTFNISVVVHGTCAEPNESKNGESDPYAAAKEMGIFKILESPLNLTTSTIIQRILTNHEAYKVNAHFCTIYSTRCFQLNDNCLEMLSRCLANLISMSTDVRYHRFT
jgi:glycerol-3-phosphate cytidylyltransferase-like family protein